MLWRAGVGGCLWVILTRAVCLCTDLAFVSSTEEARVGGSHSPAPGGKWLPVWGHFSVGPVLVSAPQKAEPETHRA